MAPICLFKYISDNTNILHFNYFKSAHFNKKYSDIISYDSISTFVALWFKGDVKQLTIADFVPPTTKKLKIVVAIVIKITGTTEPA